MEAQSYSNHRRFVPAFHFILVPLLLLTLIGSVVNLTHSLGDHQRLYSASLILVMSIALLMLLFLARIFPLRAQDRAIRAEENLRHYVLSGKLLDSRLTIRQIIGLRFASDGEFPALAQRAAAESLSQDQIKKAVKNWRADTDRV
jgi:L-cystine uptake protein TcyP (sodium:dicarboxylate symporter family)